jgi:hypothetical protein
MSQQLRLFEITSERWVAEWWKRVDPDRRQEVVRILAEMARESLGSQEIPERQGDRHASR